MNARRAHHATQLKHQRPWIDTNIVNKLEPWRLLIQVDYVSYYNTLGQTVHDLILVLHWVERRNGTTAAIIVACLPPHADFLISSFVF